METHELRGVSGGGRGKRSQALGAWRVPFERLEEVVPELPFGLGGQPFEAVNLCIDVGSVIGAHGPEDARAATRKVLATVAHYRHFFWERRGVITTLFAYWSGADVPSWTGAGLALVREILRAVPCAHAVDIGAADARALPLWVARSERFGAATGTPTIVLTGAPDVDPCAADEPSPRDLTYALSMEGENARFFASALHGLDAWTDADAARIEAQLVGGPEAETDAVAALIYDRLGPADIPIGHLFDGVDQWG